LIEEGKLTDKPRLLAVHAHPDDEASKGAATTLKYVKQGHDVLIVTCTDGQRGDLLNPNLDKDEFLKDIKKFREKELQNSIEILGAKNISLGYEDSGWVENGPVPKGSFADIPVEVAADELIKIIREFKPHVIVTYDENGGYPHPDHIRTHEISAYAWRKSGEVFYKPELGPSWLMAKMYYHQTFNSKKLQVFDETFKKLNIKNPYSEWFEKMEENFHLVTTQIECAEYFPARSEALKAHRSQIDPAGDWFAMPLAREQEIWPYEDYQLAATRVNSDLPESDLFSGLR
jgi:mycothiol S-conjugate amidase